MFAGVPPSDIGNVQCQHAARARLRPACTTASSSSEPPPKHVPDLVVKASSVAVGTGLAPSKAGSNKILSDHTEPRKSAVVLDLHTMD